jgi:hypothetical protein
MKTTNETTTTETRRVNSCYIYTGPAELLRVATDAELAEVRKRMRSKGHVNRAVVESEIAGRARRDAAYGKLTVIELRYLEESSIGETMDRFIRARGVSRRYEYEQTVRAVPIGVARRPKTT